MKAPALFCLFSVSLPFLLFAPRSGAQQPGEPVAAGFFKAVNLVSLETPTRMRLGKFEFDEGRPIAAGDNSGTLALKPDEYTFTVSNEGATPASRSVAIPLQNGAHVVAMCYDETVESDDGGAETKLRVNLLREAPPTDEPKVSLVSLLKESIVSVQIAGKGAMLHDRRAHRIEAAIDEVIPVRHDGETVGEIEVTEAAHYIAFLFREPESGAIALSLIQNERLEYQPPLEEEEEEVDEAAAEE